MNLVKELNDYFGMECKDVFEFRKDFLEEYLPEAQVANLMTFIFNIDRKFSEQN